MKTKREVWAEFGDGSVATYRVNDEELMLLANQLCDAGVSCTVWVDGRLWTRHDRSECVDDIGPAEGIAS
jgi:hypothetical protein